MISSVPSTLIIQYMLVNYSWPNNKNVGQLLLEIANNVAKPAEFFVKKLIDFGYCSSLSKWFMKQKLLVLKCDFN